MNLRLVRVQPLGVGELLAAYAALVALDLLVHRPHVDAKIRNLPEPLAAYVADRPRVAVLVLRQAMSRREVLVANVALVAPPVRRVDVSRPSE